MARPAAALLGGPAAPGRPVEPGRPAGNPPLRRRWTLAFVVGELVGFVPPALTGVTLAWAGASDPVMVVGLTLAGLLEGLALGVAQGRVLRWAGTVVEQRAWALATTAAAGFAWFVGMAGSALLGADLAPLGLVLAVVLPAWIAGLLAMGFGQWLVLRSTVARSGRWVWVSAGAWLVGVAIPVAALSLAPNGWPAWAHALVGVAGAVGMGLTVGALTGRTLEQLLGTGSRSTPGPHAAP